MRTYLKRTKGDGLVVCKNNRFFDINSGTRLDTKNVRWEPFINPIAGEVMSFLEEKGLSYIVAGANDHNIVIYNHGTRLVTIGDKMLYTSRSYRIKSIPREMILSIDAGAIKFPYYTVLKWTDMLDIFSACSEFVLEKDVKKNKTNMNKVSSNLTEREKTIYNQVIMYSKRIVSLSSNLDPTQEDMIELSNYEDINSYNCDRILEGIAGERTKTLRKIRDLCMGANSFREVINRF